MDGLHKMRYEGYDRAGAQFPVMHQNTFVFRLALLGLAALGLVLSTTASAQQFSAQDWAGTCDDKQQCFAQQQTDGPRLLMGWSADSQSIRVGALLPKAVGANQPVTIWLDDASTAIHLTTNACADNYCEAMADPEQTQQLIELFKSAYHGLLIYPQEDRLQVQRLSFLGFTSVYKKIKSAQ